MTGRAAEFIIPFIGGELAGLLGCVVGGLSPITILGLTLGTLLVGAFISYMER